MLKKISIFTIYLIFFSLFIMMFLFIHNSHTEYHKIIKPKSFNYMTESEFSTDYNDTITSETDLNLLEFNMTTYFKNLSTYSPKNSYGSCGYVTFIQCLSYYDTFIHMKLQKTMKLLLSELINIMKELK